MHGFRYLVRTLLTQLAVRYHGASLPTTPLPYALSPLVDHLCERLSHSSALWQLYGFLGHALLIDLPEAHGSGRVGTVQELAEVRLDWLVDESGLLAQHNVVIVYDFEFGETRCVLPAAGGLLGYLCSFST